MSQQNLSRLVSIKDVFHIPEYGDDFSAFSLNFCHGKFGFMYFKDF